MVPSVAMWNPWLGERLFGPMVFDSAFVGYLLTGALFGWLAWQLWRIPLGIEPCLLPVNRTAAIMLVYFYVVTEVRRSFAGVQRFGSVLTTDGEQYAYSFVTLGFGVALLAVGFRLPSRDVRLASAVFVTLAVAKVFLFDMAGLTGLWRAFSFIGLGAVLIGIGIVYQRLLFDKEASRRGAAESDAKPSSDTP